MNGDGRVDPTISVPDDHAVIGVIPALYPEWLGDRSFAEAHGCRFPYVVGEMARGIATPAMVVAAARAGLMAFFGSAGLPVDEVAASVTTIRSALGPDSDSWGSNLIHNLNEPGTEDALVDFYLRAGVRRVSASAFMSLTPAVLRYACAGLTRRPDGRAARRNHLFAKISRPEVAAHFMSPPPQRLLRELVARGHLTADEAEMGSRLPLAEDVTVEADSGGHTDNRSLTTLFPTILALRDELTRRHRYARAIRVGAAGGLGTPGALAAAFSLGAAYVLTGSINQAAIESGLSADARAMLARAELADTAMAPAADMFELGIKVQVLKRGTVFAARAARLYEIYRTYDDIAAIPAAEKTKLERDIFRAPMEEIWARTRTYFAVHNPAEIERAEREPRHLMALVFRWYLFHASRWAAAGDEDRRLDYQIWCGPAMGAFNAWARDSFLEAPENRGVVQIARNLLEGAAVVTRAQQLRSFGLPVPAAAFDFRPRPLR
jgi:PfaD family protein